MAYYIIVQRVWNVSYRIGNRGKWWNIERVCCKIMYQVWRRRSCRRHHWWGWGIARTCKNIGVTWNWKFYCLTFRIIVDEISSHMFDLNKETCHMIVHSSMFEICIHKYLHQIFRYKCILPFPYRQNMYPRSSNAGHYKFPSVFHHHMDYGACFDSEDCLDDSCDYILSLYRHTPLSPLFVLPLARV